LRIVGSGKGTCRGNVRIRENLRSHRAWSIGRVENVLRDHLEGGYSLFRGNNSEEGGGWGNCFQIVIVKLEVGS